MWTRAEVGGWMNRVSDHSIGGTGAIQVGGVISSVILFGHLCIRGIDIGPCRHENGTWKLFCMPMVRVKNISSRLERNSERGRREAQWLWSTVVVVYIGTNYIDRTQNEVPSKLRSKLKSKITYRIIFGLPSEPRVNWYRINKIREVNEWFQD